MLTLFAFRGPRNQNNSWWEHLIVEAIVFGTVAVAFEVVRRFTKRSEPDDVEK